MEPIYPDKSAARPSGIRLDRKEAVRMDTLIRSYLKASRMTAKVNTERIYSAWNAVSGAESVTLKRYYRNGTLIVTLSSAVYRSQLFPQRALLVEKINRVLADDPLFTKEDQFVGLVQNLILK